MTTEELKKGKELNDRMLKLDNSLRPLRKIIDNKRDVQVVVEVDGMHQTIHLAPKELEAIYVLRNNELNKITREFEEL